MEILAATSCGFFEHRSSVPGTTSIAKELTPFPSEFEFKTLFNDSFAIIKVPSNCGKSLLY